jgi:hypothetical protein
MRIVSFAIPTRLFQNARTISYALVALSMLLVACGGGDDKGALTGARVLHFTGRDETEANFRERTREVKLKETASWFMACSLLKGQTVAAAREFLTKDDKDDGVIPKGSVAKPGQKGVDADVNRAVEIVLEECKN